MLAYFSILVTMILGFAGAPWWTAAFGALVLATLALMEQVRYYDQAMALGGGPMMARAGLASVANAVAAALSAYAAGMVINWIIKLPV